MPLGLSLNGRGFSWRLYPEFSRALRGDHVEFDFWVFDLDYGLLYLRETRARAWDGYIPPTGLMGKRILDVGGGCGETAKFFLDNGAASVHVVENKEKCRRYLEANHLRDGRMTYDVADFNGSEVEGSYDLIKLDIEGYETRLLPYLDELNCDIVLESHCNYITDRFLEKGFSLVTPFKTSREIYGGVVQIYRWRNQS
jgi:hypothetical protein